MMGSSPSPSRNGAPQVRRTSGSFGKNKASPRSALKGMGMGGMVCSPMSAARTNAPINAPPPPSGKVGLGQQGTIQLGMPPPPARSPTRSPGQTPERLTSSGKSPHSAGRIKSLDSDDDIVYSDRYIPSRSGSNIEMGYTVMDRSNIGEGNNGGENSNNTSNNATSGAAGSSGTGGSTDSASTSEGSKEGAHTYSMLLRTELLGMESTSGRRVARGSSGSGRGSSGGTSSSSSGSGTGDASGGTGTNSSGSGSGGTGTGSARVTARGPALTTMFKYQTLRRSFDRDIDKPSLSPVGSVSAKLLASPRKAKRKIPKVPFKVLDAPALQDDFYLNLVDWSSQNILAVGLGSCVYLWSACTSKVTKVSEKEFFWIKVFLISVGVNFVLVVFVVVHICFLFVLINLKQKLNFFLFFFFLLFSPNFFKFLYFSFVI